MSIASIVSIALTPPLNYGGSSSPFDTTGADLLVISVGYFSSITVSDNKGNTWTPLTIRDSGGAQQRFYYCLGATVGTSHLFTIGTPGPATYAAATFHAFSGVASYQTEVGNISSGSQPVASGSVTPSINGALILTSIISGGDAGVDSVSPGGFTGITDPSRPGLNLQVSTAYLIQSVAASINPTWSWTLTHTNIAVATAVFLPVTSPSAETTQFSIIG